MLYQQLIRHLYMYASTFAFDVGILPYTSTSQSLIEELSEYPSGYGG